MLKPIIALRDLVARFPKPFLWLWAAGLVALAPLSLLPGTAPPTGIAGVELSLDKVFHLVAYGGLAGIAMLAIAAPGRRALAVACVLLASLGYEIGQAYVPGRSFGYDDLAANVGGVILGVAAAWWMRGLKRPA